ncbi:hypothetical protein B0H10DRAFT_1945650 [Mycena sp. CBHHK59/15]|nr:hypothetical protein B0H10DRAFT_1945650 [Mycena sp. CBHHK59/15]
MLGTNGVKSGTETKCFVTSPILSFRQQWHKGVIYYVNELVKRYGNHWFLPKRWLTRSVGTGKVMLASGYHVTDSEDGLIVDAETLDVVEVSLFEANFVQILAETLGIFPLTRASGSHWFGYVADLSISAQSIDFAEEMLHPLQDLAGSQPVYSIPLAIFIDDVSAFLVLYVQWSTAMNKAGEQVPCSVCGYFAVCNAIGNYARTSFKDPVVVWDCEAKEEVLLQPYGLLFAGDNLMQAELCSCAGLNSNFFCYTVRLSGIKDTLAQPIIDALVKMGQDLQKVNPDGSSYSLDEVQAILTEELRKHQQKGEGITNPLFDMDGKYTDRNITHNSSQGCKVWQTIWLLEKGKDFFLFQTRLNSILEDGLNVPKIQADYMCQYKGSLIGKHFKTLSQVMAFTVHSLVPQDVLEAWLILGCLTVLLWHTEIEDVTSYTTELKTCINDFINIPCKCSPSILISKPKFHFLLHLPFFIRCFGPTVLFSTERYEAYNAVFRACSIYSNNLTPSRDIAWSFAGIDRVKHIVTGGWWRGSQTKNWICTNPQVMSHILDHPEFAAMIGLPTKNTAARVAEMYKAALGVGPFSLLSFATIREILAPMPFSDMGVQVTVQLFDIQSSLHPQLHMPVAICSQQHAVLLTEDIESMVNLQHNCYQAAVQIWEKITDQEELKLVVPKNSIIPSDPLITANDNETNEEAPPVPQSAVIDNPVFSRKQPLPLTILYVDFGYPYQRNN